MGFEFGQDDARTIGEFLKSVRLQKELSIEEIAESLRIHSRFLNAIEEDRYEDLPGPIYKDLFLKAYSGYLGIDLEETLLRLPEQAPRPADEDLDKGKEPPKSEEEREIRKDIRKMPTAAAGGIKRTRTHMFVLGALAIVVVIVMIVVLQFGGSTSVPTSTEPTPTTVDTTSPLPADTIVPADTMPVLERLVILVESIDTSYAEVYADAESIQVGYVMPGDPIWCTMQDSMWLKIGAPEKARVWIDSMPIRLEPVSNTGVFSGSLTRENYLDFVDSTLLLEWQ